MRKSFFLQKCDWIIARTYSTFLLSHHTNPAYTLVYSNGKKNIVIIFSEQNLFNFTWDKSTGIKSLTKLYYSLSDKYEPKKMI